MNEKKPTRTFHFKDWHWAELTWQHISPQDDLYSNFIISSHEMNPSRTAWERSLNNSNPDFPFLAIKSSMYLSIVCAIPQSCISNRHHWRCVYNTHAQTISWIVWNIIVDNYLSSMGLRKPSPLKNRPKWDPHPLQIIRGAVLSLSWTTATAPGTF